MSLSTNVILAGIAILTEIRSRRIQPKLMVRLDSTSAATNISTDGAEGRFFIVNIMNKNIHTPATNVKLLIVKMMRSIDLNSWRQCPVNGPVQVSWRRPGDMQQVVNVGSDAQCTILALYRGKPTANIPLLGLVPNNFQHLLQPNEYVRLTLQAVAENSRSKKMTIQIYWDGQWPQDQDDEHLRISTI
jgi:hypothetical protein